MEIKKYISLIIVCLCIGLPVTGLLAQVTETTRLIKGSVVNEYNEPLPDVLVTSEYGKNHFFTGVDGEYELSVSDGSRYVVFSALGFKDRKIELELSESIDVELEFDAHRTGGTINLGYFTQPVEANVGAISTVTGNILDRTPTSTLSQTFPGRFIGLSTIEVYSELNRASILKLVRGLSTVNGNQPLAIIDGIVCPNVDYDFLSPKEIDNIVILKDASSTAIYGIQGANGAIVINTKRGYIGKRRINVFIDQSFQEMTRRPEFLNSFEYAQLRNEAGVNDGLGAYSQFTASQLDAFRDGTNPKYPNNDWYGMFMKKMVMMQRVGLNVSGGTEKMRYFSNVNYMHQEGQFKIANEPSRKYDPTPNIHMLTFRSNLDLKFNRFISAFMRISGNVDYDQSSTRPQSEVYPLLFTLPPTMYGPVTPPNEENPELGEQVVTHDNEDNPVYGLLNRSGYAHWLRTNVRAQAGVTLDMDFLTPGLSLTGMMAYQTFVYNITYTRQEFARYVRSSDYNSLDFTKKGAEENTPLAYARGHHFFYNLNLLGHLNYSRRFGDHSIDAMAYLFYLMQEKYATSGNSILPYKRESMGVTALYGYRDKYFIKGDLGYSGSEQFHPDYRYTATPAVGVSWIASKEDFMADSDVLSLLKLRTSYGVSASDQLGDARFLYLDYIDQYGNEGLRGNPKLSAEKIKKQNYGIDLGLVNALSVSFDYFIHNADNMLVSSIGTIPTLQGIPLSNYPKLNNGKMENKGYEIELKYDGQFTPDLYVFAGAGYSHARNKVTNYNETQLGEDYAYRYRSQGYPLGQQWGYRVDYSNGNGMFNSESELNNSKLTYDFGEPRVGDFIYQDLNNDGIIDDRDMAPIGSSWIPENYYHFTGGLSYKNLEFSFLLQGAGNSSFRISGLGAYENQAEGVFTDLHKNAWTPERYARNEKIDHPALSLTNTTNFQSDFYVMDGSYLRLRNLELAYSLPVSISKKIAAERIRFVFNAQNLFTIDKVKSKYIDPEVGIMGTFQPYRVYNIGVSLNF